MVLFTSVGGVSNICWSFLIIIIGTSKSNAKTIVSPPTNDFITTQSQTQQNESTDLITTAPTLNGVQSNQDITLGSCLWAIGRQCPDEDVEFYLYTRKNPHEHQRIVVYGNGTSNLSLSLFDNHNPTKFVIHGYNADMYLHALQSIKNEFLSIGEYNIFYVEWSKLALGPCYINAVYNIRHVGRCVAQLIQNIIAEDNRDIHIIGFSLGAQLANFIARNLDEFQLPRITGLDPALPLFITSPNEEKLDASDAMYVDVMHTNALVQGKFEQCGHSDVYMNGGIFQPNCINENIINPFNCFHHRSIEYYVESIRSIKGFWAWPCSSYLSYIVGMCPPTNNLVEIGANIKNSTRGMHFVDTYGNSPYAMGKWTSNSLNGSKTSKMSYTTSRESKEHDSMLRYLEQWGKLHHNFNNPVQEVSTQYP